MNSEILDVCFRPDYHQCYFRYLRALCHKALGNYKESQRDYEALIKVFQMNEGKHFSKQIFSMVMIPLQVNRKTQLKYVETFEQILDRYEDNVNRKVLSQFYCGFKDPSKAVINPMLSRDNTHPKWLDRKFTEVLRAMQNMYFFKRFTVKRIREFMDEVEIDVIQKMNILFFQPDKVYVIVSGSILMKNHESNTELPDTLAKFAQGDILNFMQDKM
jgi:hypothetical protein